MSRSRMLHLRVADPGVGYELEENSERRTVETVGELGDGAAHTAAFGTWRRDDTVLALVVLTHEAENGDEDQVEDDDEAKSADEENTVKGIQAHLDLIH